MTGLLMAFRGVHLLAARRGRPDQAGIIDVFPVWVTPDGERYAYAYRRCLSDFYLVSGSTRVGRG